MPIQTCLVQSISISAAGNPPANTSFVVNTGTSTTLNATVTDSLGMTLTGVPLTWNTSNPVSVGASGATSTVFGGVGTASSPTVGAVTVIASCTPPTCNGGIKPSLPIYPQSAISFTVHSNSAPANPTVYASTTACATANPTNATCNTTIVPISKSSSTSVFAAGGPVVLPFSPNSIVYDSNGTSAFLGVDSSNFGQKGLMIFSGTSVSQFTGAPGKVLAVSPDHTLAVISDTVDSPNQVFICNNCNTSSRSASAFLITGATAAAFSPDSKMLAIGTQRFDDTNDSSTGGVSLVQASSAIEQWLVTVPGWAKPVEILEPGRRYQRDTGAGVTVRALHGKVLVSDDLRIVVVSDVHSVTRSYFSTSNAAWARDGPGGRCRLCCA